MTVFWGVAPSSLGKFVNISEALAASTPEKFMNFY
jgi:hypothetical protein